jgi:2-polyprenyl-6-methoxyphenol hydroxylase-like FAD-dependent oxidoreductase
VCLGFAAALEEIPTDRAAQMALTRKTLGHMRWQMPRLLDAMDTAPDFYMGPMAQVKMAHWTKGRIALVGDAGYSPSPLTGQGTSLALVGGYVLAWELAQSPDDHAAAFARYETKLRPFVEKNHAITDVTRDERFSDPDYYVNVVEPAMDAAKDAIELEGLR